MGKKIIAALALVLCFLLAFAGCDGTVSTEKISKDGSASNVSSNGGFLAETGDYVYFINGSEVYTADNTAGKVDKGSLVRVKKSELAKGAKAEKETVVSKLLSTGDHSAGIAIYNEKIYYATPSNVKSKTGNVQNTDIKFCYVSTDGTGNKEFAASAGDNSTAYRFVQAGGKVYVVYVGSETVTENGSDTTKNYIYVVSDEGKTVAKEEYSAYIFDKNVDGKYVYFTRSVNNETLGSTESFNEVYRLEIGAENAEKILYGAGSNRNTDEVKYDGKGIQGVTFALVAAENGNVYYSVTYVDTSVTTVTYYAFLGEDLDADAEENYKNATVMTHGGSSTVFAATSVYLNPECIIYIDANKGLCSYNYTLDDDYNAYFGIDVENDSDDIKAATLAYITDEYIYCQNGGVYYRMKYTYEASAADNSSALTAEKETKVSPVTFSTAWYAPEIVKAGGKEYVLGTLSGSDYYDYVFAFEVVDGETLEKNALEIDEVKAYIEETYTDEEKLADVKKGLEDTDYAAFLTGTAKDNVYYIWTKVASKLGADAQKTVDDHLKTTYDSSSDASSSSTESGCSSAMGAGALAGVAVIALAGIFLGKKRA